MSKNLVKTTIFWVLGFTQPQKKISNDFLGKMANLDNQKSTTTVGLTASNFGQYYLKHVNQIENLAL